MKTIIIGIDEYAQFFFESMPTKNKNEVIGFANWDFSKNDKEIFDKKIFDIFEIFELRESVNICLAIPHNRHLSIALEKLHDYGIRKVYYIPLFILENKINMFEDKNMLANQIRLLDLSRPYLVHLETHVVDYCNLKCKGCNNFAPLFSVGENCSSERFLYDLRLIKEKFGGVLRLFLLGGEPLLNEILLKEFVSIGRNMLPDAEIYVLTNGLLLDTIQDELLDLFAKNNICIKITYYKPVGKKIDQILNRLKLKKVRVMVSKPVNSFIKRLTVQPMENPYEVEKDCGSAGCTFLRDGKLSKCPDAILVDRYDYAFGTHFKSKDDIILESQENGYEIIKKINRPIDMCQYCTNRVEEINWEPCGSEIRAEDWLTTDKLSYYERYNKGLESSLEEIQREIAAIKEARRKKYGWKQGK